MQLYIFRKVMRAAQDDKPKRTTFNQSLNELALAADRHYVAECMSVTDWIVRGFTALGADAAALVPDAA